MLKTYTGLIHGSFIVETPGDLETASEAYQKALDALQCAGFLIHDCSILSINATCQNEEN